MEEVKQKIKTNFNIPVILKGGPVVFSIEGRRPIYVKLPTLSDSMESLDFNTFIALLMITPERLKEFKIEFPFETDSQGKIIQGMLQIKEFSTVLKHFLGKYIISSQIKEKEIFLEDEKILSYELEYIANVILIAAGYKFFDENLTSNLEKQMEEEKKVSDPVLRELLKKEREAELKLKRAKDKKNNKEASDFKLEDLLITVSHEFNMKLSEVFDLNFYTLIWYYSFVYKIDVHKVHQIAAGNGLLKKGQSYKHWLNTK